MKLGILMDPIDQIHIEKDTSFALLLEAQARGYEVFYMEPQDISLQDGICWGQMERLSVIDHADVWYEFGEESVMEPLAELDVLLMRKDPPFDMQYVYLTYLLEQAEAQGLCVINRPSSLRDANEKLFTSWFPQCCPKTLVSSEPQLLREFVGTEGEVVLKPLGAMGGTSVFRANASDPNLSVIIETLTQDGRVHIMAQHFISDIERGDKRVILINGEPMPCAIARVPSQHDFRGNIARGASSVPVELTDRDYWICEQVAPTLQNKGLDFVGLDIIGDYLTEINVTSPTCVREIEMHFDINICGEFFDYVETLIEE